MMRHSVLIVAGSETDLPVMEETKKTLDRFRISSQIVVLSAHRQPDKVRVLAKRAQRQGVKVIIAGAGMAAHLAGVIASHTTIPVIGVPLATEPFAGLDSLLSTVQMPRGVPVAAVSVGRSGAVNAAILAVEILALRSESLRRELEEYRITLGSGRKRRK